MPNGDDSDSEHNLSRSDGGWHRPLSLLAAFIVQFFPIVETEENWAVKPWYRSGAGWFLILLDLAVLKHILKNTRDPASTQELMILSSVISPSIYIFYVLSNNKHLKTYDLLNINMKIPLGVGVGVMVLVFSRKVTSIPEILLIALCFWLAFSIDRLVELLIMTVDFLADVLV